MTVAAPDYADACALAASTDDTTRVRAGASAATPPEILYFLARDRSVTVRAAVAMNGATPIPAVHLLAADDDERVRALIARKLAALAPGLSAREQEQVRRHTYEALAGLVSDEATRVRAALADVLKAMPDAPRELVLALAHDRDDLVAQPVIEFSPLLTDEDLLALLAEPPAAATAHAVARRTDLNEAVSDAVAATADVGAIRLLLNNRSAAIREATLDALIARAAEHVDWHEPLVHRPALSPASARRLSEIVATHLLAVLSRRVDLGPGVLAELHRTLSERLERDRHSWLVAGPGTAGSETAGWGTPGAAAAWSAAAPVSRPPASIAPGSMAPGSMAPDAITPGSVVRHSARWTATARSTPARTGAVTEAMLLQATQAGDPRAAAAMLAIAAGVPLAYVERAAALRSAKGLLSLLWKAGFTMQVAGPVQALLARLAPGTLLAPDPSGNFPLTSDEMRWQIDFLGRMER